MKDDEFVVKIKGDSCRYIVEAKNYLAAKNKIICIFRGKGREIEVLTVTIKQDNE